MRNVVAAALLLAAVASPVYAQSGAKAPPPVRTLSLAGPRVGLTFLSDGVIQKLQRDNVAVGSTISQFGWQFERQFYANSHDAWVNGDPTPFLPGPPEHTLTLIGGD